MKRVLFRFYPLIAAIAFVGGCLLVWRVGADQRLPLIGGVLAAALGFIYFVQQQKLAETQLFKSLFTEFNQRYDRLNDRLGAIPIDLPASVEHRGAIVDYFNLCAEEYLFYREGYIHPAVWRSWCRGMLQYLDRQPFRDVWSAESKTESYYGLSLAIIQSGAR